MNSSFSYFISEVEFRKHTLQGIRNSPIWNTLEAEQIILVRNIAKVEDISYLEFYLSKIYSLTLKLLENMIFSYLAHY